MRCQKRLDHIVIGHVGDRPIHGAVDALLRCPPAILADPGHQPRVLVQRPAVLHHLRVAAPVHVQHPHPHLDIRIRPRRKGIAQPQGLLIRFFPGAVVEHHQPRHRQRQQPGSVLVHAPLPHVLFIQVPRVLQQPHRHIGVIGRLLLVQVHLLEDQKRDVVVHAQVHDFPYGGDLDGLRVLIVRTIDGVVQAQGPGPVLLRPEQKVEEPVLVARVFLGHAPLTCLYASGLSLWL